MNAQFGGAFLDITLKRILSLIPKRADGKYVHGAKKKFAESIGYVGGEIVNMWENGSSKSYMGKLYEISSIYNVSVEWLKGETNEPSQEEQKEKPPVDGELRDDIRELIRLYDNAPAEFQAAALSLLKSAEAARKVQDEAGEAK